jgi:hypothetical protein
LTKGAASGTLKRVAKNIESLKTKSASEYKTCPEEEEAAKGNSA